MTLLILCELIQGFLGDGLWDAAEIVIKKLYGVAELERCVVYQNKKWGVYGKRGIWKHGSVSLAKMPRRVFRCIPPM